MTRPALRRIAAAAARVLRTVVGAPDYDRYLAHHHRQHGDHTPLSRAEFERRRLAERYERPGARCC